MVRRRHMLLSAADVRLERRLDEVAAQAVAKARKAAAASKVSAATVQNRRLAGDLQLFVYAGALSQGC
jgi:hypothetical protein